MLVASATAPGRINLVRSMDMAEFVAVQRLSDPAIRERFSLPASCDPSVSAVRQSTGRFDVVITCDEAGTAPASRPGPRDTGRRR